MTRDQLSAAIYIIMVPIVILSRFWPSPLIRDISVALTVAFLTLEISRTPAFQRNIGIIIAVIGGIAAWAGGNFLGAIYQGLEKAQLFMVMFFAVMWLRDPAVTSPSLRNLRDAAIRQPPGRRYPIIWLTTHFLSSVLNFAALSLLSVMATEQTERKLQRRLSIAIMMGFAAAASWGPFYVSVAVILTAIPQVRWIDIAPLGLVLSAFTLAIGWGYDRIFLRTAPTGPKPQSYLPIAAVTVGRAAFILSLLAILVLGIHQTLGLAIPVALGVIGPPFAIVWVMMQSPVGARWPKGVRPLFGRILRIVPDLRNEAVAFCAASVFGVGVTQLLPPTLLKEYIQGWDLGGDTIVVLIILGMNLASCIGLHPVILVILVGEIMPPDVIGIPAPLLAISMLGAWGTSTMISPFSATTLFMARAVNVPSHVIAWRWCAPIAAITALFVAAYVVAIRHLLFSL